MPTVAAIQMTSTDNWQTNLSFIEDKVALAAASGAKLVVLPENAVLFAGQKLRALTESEDQQIIIQRLSSIAFENKVFLAVGSHPSLCRPDGIVVPDGRVRQSFLFFSDEGKQIARYDKIHLFDASVGDQNGQYKESSIIEHGDLVTEVVDIDFMKVGLSICYDLRFPEMYRLLADKGADIILVPAAFTYKTGSAHWHALLKARAIENQVYMLGIGQCGQHTPTRQTYGNTVCYSPWGNNLAQLEHEPGILSVNIDLGLLQECRNNMPVHQHRRF